MSEEQITEILFKAVRCGKITLGVPLVTMDDMTRAMMTLTGMTAAKAGRELRKMLAKLSRPPKKGDNMTKCNVAHGWCPRFSKDAVRNCWNPIVLNDRKAEKHITACVHRLRMNRLHRAFLRDPSALGLNYQWQKECVK